MIKFIYSFISACNSYCGDAICTFMGQFETCQTCPLDCPCEIPLQLEAPHYGVQNR